MAPSETMMAPNSERGRKLREGVKKKKDLRKEKKGERKYNCLKSRE
jgi:hypothetical protein